MSCNNSFEMLIAIGIVIFIYRCMSSESYRQSYQHSKNSKNSKNEETKDLIGLIYPPKAGPLHTNIEFPVKRDSCTRPFTAIYKQDPYLKHYQVKHSC